MKRLVFALAISLTGMQGLATADTLDDVKARGTLVCGVLTGYEPYSFQDTRTRGLTGYEVDYCNELARYLKVKPELKVVTTQGRIPEITQHRVDVLAARISYTSARAAQIGYSGIYETTAARFMVLQGSGLKADDFKGEKRIGISKGSPLDQFLRETYPKATVLSFDDLTLAYAALRAGRVDGLLAPTTALASFRVRSGDKADTVVLPDAIYPTRTSFNVAKGEDRMVAAINEFLISAEASGLAQQIFDKWFGANSTYKLEKDFIVGSPQLP